jgi:predicted alpha-1,6-mannanase (GH76 family)
MKLRPARLAFAVCGIWLFAGYAGSAANTLAPEARPTPTTQVARAASGVVALQKWYDHSSGLYESTGWWNSANALTVLIDFARVSKTRQFDSVFANTFAAAQKTFPGFLNKFYDDEGWWALAWIDAYDLTRDRRYLSMAESIFADMAGGWDSTCGGGIWWSKDRGYKNAIANELFLSVAAHLAKRDRSQSARYLGWANREWKWFSQSGMINSEGLVNDGLGSRSGHTTAQMCRNNGQRTWTYNQGVLLGGLAELSRLQPDASIAQTAQRVAMAAVIKLVDSHGVLHETCEAKCGADGVQFKGIFVRNLRAWNAAAPRQQYTSFIITNANSIWLNDQGPGVLFGLVWSGPFDGSNAGGQSSALDAIVSAAILEQGY